MLRLCVSTVWLLTLSNVPISLLVIPSAKSFSISCSRCDKILVALGSSEVYVNLLLGHVTACLLLEIGFADSIMVEVDKLRSQLQYAIERILLLIPSDQVKSICNFNSIC